MSGNFLYSVTFAMLITLHMTDQLKANNQRKSTIIHVSFISLSIIIPIVAVVIGGTAKNSFK
jgi:hypothetical protein